MPAILYFGLIVLAIFLLAKILIPILTVILILFVLISLISPFFFFMIVGYIFGTKEDSFREKVRKIKRRTR